MKHIPAGTKIHCPKCELAQAEFLKEVPLHVKPDWAWIKFLVGRVLKEGKPLAISICCKEPWVDVQSNYYTEHGWIPFNIHKVKK